MTTNQLVMLHDVTLDDVYVTIWMDARGLKVRYHTQQSAKLAHAWLVEVLRRFAEEGERRRSTKPKIYVYGKDDVNIVDFIVQFQDIVEGGDYYTEWVKNEDYSEINEEASGEASPV
jgi:hypothetical protein